MDCRRRKFRLPLDILARRFARLAHLSDRAGSSRDFRMWDARSEKGGMRARASFFRRRTALCRRDYVNASRKMCADWLRSNEKTKRFLQVHTYVRWCYICTEHFRESCRCTNANLDERATTQACICAWIYIRYVIVMHRFAAYNTPILIYKR